MVKNDRLDSQSKYIDFLQQIDSLSMMILHNTEKKASEELVTKDQCQVECYIIEKEQS